MRSSRKVMEVRLKNRFVWNLVGLYIAFGRCEDLLSTDLGRAPNYRIEHRFDNQEINVEKYVSEPV